MSQWYLSKNGKAQGPLGEDKIISLIESGEVGHIDLVFQAGSTEWLPISEVETFSVYLKKNEPSAKASDDTVEWVLLKKTKGEKGSEYNQLGPFSKDQVLDLIERGEIRFKDFAWKQGLESWVPIGDVQEFAEPLPSTPEVDKDMYVSPPEVTQVDEDISSMSELIEIEHFEHEKTQVMKPSEIPLNSVEFATETDFNTPTNFTQSQVEELSLEQDSLVAEAVHEDVSEDDEDIDHETDADLWSLQPPETKSDAGQVKQKVKKTKKAKKPPRKKKVKESGGPSKKVEGRPVIDLTESPWPWIAAAGILFLSVIFLYMSFSGNGDEVAKKEAAAQEKSSVLSEINPEDFEGMSLDNPPEEIFQEEPTDQVAAAPMNDPQLNMGLSSKREISSKSKKISKKKNVVKKAKKKVVKKARKKKPSVRTSVAGSKKSKSFYKQRDRKAIFYSSLKVEGLITELEQKFKKLKKKKKSWKKFYSGWKKKARTSMPSLVKKFPQKRAQYAYPKLLSSFKRDHKLVLKYGAVYNAKVLGLRRPAGVPKNVKSLFRKHKKQAQSLGK